MIVTALNWVVNKFSWFLTSVLHIPDIPDFITEPVNFLLNLFETCVSWVSWLFPSVVWYGICDLFIIYITAKLTYMVYKLIIKLIGIFL